MVEKSRDVGEIGIQFHYPPDAEMSVGGEAVSGQRGMMIILTFLAMRNLEMLVEFQKVTSIKSGGWDDVAVLLKTTINGATIPVDFNEVRDTWNEVMGGDSPISFDAVARATAWSNVPQKED